MDSPNTEPHEVVGEGNEAVADSVEVTDADHALREEMLKGIRSWGIWAGIFGILQFIAADVLSSSWGVALLLVAVSSFLFRSASMYVVYGIVMGWAAVTNLLSGEVIWLGLAVLQVVWAVRLFRKFSEFRRGNLTQSPAPGGLGGSVDYDLRSEKVFPWASFGLGIASFLGVACMLMAIFGFVVVSQPGQALPYEAVLNFLFALASDLGLLAVAVGVASLLARYRRRGLAIIGIATGALIILALIVIGLLPDAAPPPNPLSG